MTKRLISLVTISVFSFLVLSCNSNEKNKSIENTEAKSEVVSSNNSTENLNIQFTGTEDFEIKNPKVKVSLYAHDPLLADVPAVLITEQEYEETTIPFTINMPVPKDAMSDMDPKKKDRMKYYVSIEWDSDGNGKVGDKRDIYIDHDKEFPNVKLNGEQQTVYLKIMK